MRLRVSFGAALALGLAAAPALAQEEDGCVRSQYAGDQYFPAPAFEGQTRAPAAEASAFAMDVVASDLNHPWAIAFLPDGRMLLTLRPGAMVIVSPDGIVSAPIANVPEVRQAQLSGMTDLLLDPDFASNRTLYFNMITLAPGEAEPGRNARSVGRVMRARLSEDGTALEDVTLIHETKAGATRRLVWAPDGTLLVTLGTGLVAAPEPRALDSDIGKVIRINPDGSIPADNPFAGVAGALPELYDIGHRDPEGATINPETGELWTVEHGPRGGDELNRVRPGADYGHGHVSYGRAYDEALINGGATQEEGIEQPLYFWTPSIGPSGLLFYTGDAFPDWKGDLFLGSMPMKHLVRLELDGERVVAEEKLLWDLCQRIRDVRQGPDGLLYVLTDEDQGQLLRLRPAE
jgi:glucose/arabinose dehydrogenase